MLPRALCYYPPSSATTLRASLCMALTLASSSNSTTCGALSMSTTTEHHPLSAIRQNLDHSWIGQLSPESSSNRQRSLKVSGDAGAANTVMRPVYNGHYVLVRPTPLKNPRLVIYSRPLAAELGFTEEDAASVEFTKFFSGDFGSDQSAPYKAWATPYALSIMGTRYTNNCPFGTGDGYGDGRAISIAELVLDDQKRFEFQLKGAGTTPFCRGADGRAVLRSSIREFLASEAMHFLGISTTRALSLIVSDNGNYSQRPWYSQSNTRQLPDLQDPRLARYTVEQRRQIIAQLSVQSKNDPDIMVSEPNAITCRVATSFMRIGHIDLFARRATRGNEEWKELEQVVWHACFREYRSTCYDPYFTSGDIGSASKCLLRHSLQDIATMVSEWIRVGFSQGNFNSDNCLVAGRTMDYGPFGFMDEYHPLFAKWTGSGEHFGFLNQPSAGYANFVILLESIMPLVAKNNKQEAEDFRVQIMEEAQRVFQAKVDEVLRVKMGFHKDDENADELWKELEGLLRTCRADWTLFWRQLTRLVQKYPVTGEQPFMAHEETFEYFYAKDDKHCPFYEPLNDDNRQEVLKWIKKWRETLIESNREGGASYALSQDDDTSVTPQERMRLANPKYILREWMLVEAYTKASPTLGLPSFISSSSSSARDESMIHELLALTEHPYDEGTEEEDEKYYRRAPDAALNAGGTAFMSCSS